MLIVISIRRNIQQYFYNSISFLEQHGTNHGIELYEDCLKYAYERLEEFKDNSLAINEFDFCEPIFVQGNTV